MHTAFSLFLQPTFLLYLLLGVAIANLWRNGKESRIRLLLVTVPFLLLSLACTRAAGIVAHRALEWRYQPLHQVPEDTQAIVVLAGYVRPGDSQQPEPELGTDTLYRCVHAAQLYQNAAGKYPLLVSGGPIKGDARQRTLAGAMRDFLIGQGVAATDLIVEDRSINTYENAVESAKLLKTRGVRRIVLVTDAEHMLRSAACFRKQHLEVTPAPVRRQEFVFPANLDDYVPNPREAGDFELATREWLAIAYYWACDRL
jgi:uncharacterized SAM-binding protein YcdF (DUF218 family)